MMESQVVTISKKYTGVKVISQLKALQCREINSHLSLEDRNRIDEIENIYRSRKYLTREQMSVVWRYYDLFVLKDFRYKKR